MEAKKIVLYSFYTALLVFLSVAIITAIVKAKRPRKPERELTKFEFVERLKKYAENKQAKEIILSERETNEIETKEIPSQTRKATMIVESLIKNSYFVPVDGQWSFLIKDKTLRVVAPAIEAKKLEIDPKKIKGNFINVVSVMDGLDKMELFKKEFIENMEKKATSEKVLLNVFDSSRLSLAIFLKDWIKKDLWEKGFEINSVLIKFSQEQKFPQLPYKLIEDSEQETDNN